MGWIENTYSGAEWIEYQNTEWNEYPEPFYLLKQIWTDSNYVYAATTDGLNIVDLTSELPYAHITYTDGFNSVWADVDNVYLASPASGIKYIEKTCISGSTVNPYELINCLQDYLNEPEILSDKVRYIHGNNGHMIISTVSGINYRGPDLYYQKSESHTKLAKKVFITPSGRIYYIIWDGINWKVNVKYADNQDWTLPNKTITTSGIDIMDIYVTENSTTNTIFIATISGIRIIDETTNTTDIYYTSASGLAGTSNVFTAVWADSDADINNGKVYALSWGLGAALSVLNLDTKMRYDQYTQTNTGRVQETLNNNDTRDLNVDTP